MNKTIKIMMLTFMLIIMSTMTLAVCNTETYEDTTNSTDFLQINTSTYNTITMSVDQKWLGWSFFTPRTNQTKIVYETLTGLNAGQNYSLHWITIDNNYTLANGSFILKNGTNTIPTTNYTLYSNGSQNRTWFIYFKDSRYNTTTLVAQFNRTFYKNTEDLYLNASGIQSAYTFNDFIQENTPTDWGSNKEFRPNPTGYGGMSINLSDWAIGWRYTQITCSESCENTPNQGLMNAIFMALMALIIVYAVFKIKDKGEKIEKKVSVVTISLIALIAIMLFMWILNTLITTLC